MAKKQMSWKTKGMNRDLSVSAFNPEFAFENMNLRLSTNEGNTLMSWVNERGTMTITTLAINETPWISGSSATGQYVKGKTIGTAVLNDKLVLFTTASTDNPTDWQRDSIYVLQYDRTGGGITGKRIFCGRLNFSAEWPIETLVSYEAEDIQKVYWTDGLNQPRVINIEANEKTLEKWNQGFINHWTTEATYFDFVPTLKDQETVTITKNPSGGGIFAPGVIQYCFSYINRYGQQSNIFYVSTLYYLSFSDRGASPEEKVNCNFNIVITDVDRNFDYIRIYSIQRTSYNDTPYVRRLGDIKIENDQPVYYVDNGTAGSSVDPTELLFLGGREISALTMSYKDGTLFLGNINIKNNNVSTIQKYYDDNRDTSINNLIFKNDSQVKGFGLNHSTGIYEHTQTLNSPSDKITTFKGGEYYRFGIQLQKATGEWTDPIYIDDKQNSLYPSTNIFNDWVTLSYAEMSIDLAPFTDSSGDYYIPNFTKIYKKIRPVIVYPSIADRQVLCQGVLNPTVFNVEDRRSNSPFAQASWFFRPYDLGLSGSSGSTEIRTVNTKDITTVDYTHDTAFDNHISSVYVLIGETAINEQLFAEGSLNCTIAGAFTVPHDFIGVIDLAVKSGDIHYVAFLSSSKWEESNEHVTYTYIGLDYAYVAYRITNPATDPKNYLFEMYDSYSVNNKGYIYYTDTLKQPGTTNTFRFDLSFHDNSDHFYSVIFNDYVASYDINAATGGHSVEYKHYYPLITSISGDSRFKQEIQGASNTYDNPYSSSGITGSNTEFFVDQSIVTLNSPDIEFDTEVQTYSKGNYSLHIVGLIPITANASAHSIATASAMSESNHNQDSGTHTFGIGEKFLSVQHNNIDSNAGNRLVSENLWNDARFDTVYEDPNTHIEKYKTLSIEDFLIYPWQRSGSLTDDTRTNSEAASVLRTKKESTLLYSINSKYTDFGVDSAVTPNITLFSSIDVQMALTENAEVFNIRLSKQNSLFPDINYYGNIDKVVYNSNGYPVIYGTGNQGKTVTTPVSIKYKSASHAIISFMGATTNTPVLPYVVYNENNYGEGKLYGSGTESNHPYWCSDNKPVYFYQGSVTVDDAFSTGTSSAPLSFLWLAELHKSVDPTSRFGGTSKSALKNNVWTVAGEAKDVTTATPIVLNWTEGDTYYQRYDCLKTYPFTNDDPNQLVEILSFLCETHVNIDGRYDRNRGQIDNTNMSPQNFNLLNPVYSQRNNFFNYKSTFDESSNSLYPNLITYSKTKESGADVDLWTNITLASTLELDGNKGSISAIDRFNDQLLAFQKTGFSQILYNENVQISTAQGVPIELANSGKVTGARYISNNIGCTNKWSLYSAPSGIYFIDSNDRSIYRFNGQLENLSISKGMNAWSKKNISPTDVWRPDNQVGFTVVYDGQNKDVLFINNDTALAFSEKFDMFSSFYSYQQTPYLANVEELGFWIKQGGTQLLPQSNLYLHQKGKYCEFFGANKPYWMTLVGNPEVQTDKIFTNLEFRACVEGDSTYDGNTGKFTPTLPFDSLEAWDEYQHGYTTLENKNGHDAMVHGGGSSALKRKFRIWRCDIPRDNVPVVTLPDNPTPEEIAAYNAFKKNEGEKGISRVVARPLDRMRNPWVYLKLKKDVPMSGDISKVEVHDLVMTYFN